MDERVLHKGIGFEPELQAQGMNLFPASREGKAGDGFEGSGKGVVVRGDAFSTNEVEERNGEVRGWTESKGMEEGIPDVKMRALEEAGDNGVREELVEVVRGQDGVGEEKPFGVRVGGRGGGVRSEEDGLGFG